jgi:hypothetical protein
VLKGGDVSQALIYMTIDLKKSPTKLSQQQHKFSNLSDGGKEEQPSICSDAPFQFSLLSETQEAPLPDKTRPEQMVPPKEIFNQTILKISFSISQLLQQGSFNPLDIPDGFVNENFVRNSMADQLGIRLSRQEVYSLCDRLRRGNDSSNVSPTKKKKKTGRNHVGGSASVSFLPQIKLSSKNRGDCTTNEESEEREDIILGKYVKVFITSMKQMCSKRMGVEPCKPIFAK